MSRKLFQFADNVVFLCIHNETINNDALQALAFAFKNSWSTIATNDSIPSTQLINVVRFLECKIDATVDGFADLFRSPGLSKCEFQKTQLQSTFASALCKHTLRHTPDLLLTFDTSPEEKELLIDPFGFYAELQHWRRHWWLEGAEHAVYQQLVSTATILQMRFFSVFLHYYRLQGAIFELDEWKSWCVDVENLLTALKKYRASQGAPAELLPVINDLIAEIRIFAPPFASDVSVVDRFNYFMLLDNYRNLRFLVSEINYTCLTRPSFKFSPRPFKFLLSLLENVLPWEACQPLGWIRLAGLGLLYRFCASNIKLILDRKNGFFEIMMPVIAGLFEQPFLRKLKYDPSYAEFGYDINIGYLSYFDILDNQALLSPDPENMALAISTLKNLLRFLNYDFESPYAKLASSLLFKKHLRPELDELDALRHAYIVTINNVLNEHTDKLSITQVKLPKTRLDCCHSEQLILLNYYYHQLCLYIKSIAGRSITARRTMVMSKARASLSENFHRKHPLNLTALKWAEPKGHRSFQASVRNTILDQGVGSQERRVFFENLFYYFLHNLEYAHAYLECIDNIVASNKSKCFPSMLFDSHTAICSIQPTTTEQHRNFFLLICTAIFSLLDEGAMKCIRLPTLKNILNYSAADLQGAIEFFQKTIRLAEHVLLPKNRYYFDTNTSHLVYDFLTLAEQIQKISRHKIHELTTLITKHKELCAQHVTITWERYVTAVTPKTRQPRMIKPKTRNEKPKQIITHVPKQEPDTQELEQPSYLSTYPRLAPIHSLIENRDYPGVLQESKLLLDELSQGEHSNDPANLPILAYLYYAIADSLRMQCKKQHQDERMIFDYLLQGYQFVHRLKEANLPFDSDLASLFGFLIQEVESSFYFAHAPVAAMSPTTSTQEPSVVEFKCQFPEAVRALLDIVFTYFPKESLYFYGSFVLTTIHAALHSQAKTPAYSDVDIVIFSNDLTRAFEFMKSNLPQMKESYRAGLYRGTFQKVAFDIQIAYSRQIDAQTFAKTLGLGCRSAMADHTGQCFDFTEKAFDEIQNKITHFLPGINLQENKLAIFNHLRTQAQYRFAAHIEDEKAIRDFYPVLLDVEPWLLRDYFSRHFQQGYASKSCQLWFQYRIFTILLPQIADLDYTLFLPLCEKLDADYQYFKIEKLRPIVYVLAEFLQVVVTNSKPTAENLPACIDKVTMNTHAPLLKNLPPIAMTTLYATIRKGCDKIESGSEPSKRPVSCI